MRDLIGSNQYRLWLLVILLHPVSLLGQQYPGHRLTLGAGTILLLPDSTTGLTLWATRTPRPGYQPSPDFVGWFAPESVTVWSSRARQFLSGSGAESASLVGPDGGGVSLIRLEGSCCALAFGHSSEQQRWVIEASSVQFIALLDSLDHLAHSSRLHPPLDLGYANPTNRIATPDRELGPPPSLRGRSGEVWATMTLDEHGAVVPATGAILWASRPELGEAVLKVLPGFRYRRKDGGTRRLVVYQRFRVR